MPYLKLIHTPGRRAIELREAVVRLGRDPLFALSVPLKHAVPLPPLGLRQRLGI